MRSQLSFEPHPFIRPPSRSRVHLCPFRGWGWFERKARRHQIHQKDNIKMRSEAPGVWVDFIPNVVIFRNCRLGNVQGHHSVEGVKSIPRGTTYHRTVGFIEPPVQGLCSLLCRQGKGSFITDHPPGPTLSPFTTCRVRGVYYYPDPPQVAFYQTSV